MAHKKGQGSVRNGRDSISKRLGVKAYGGQAVTAGSLMGQLLLARKKLENWHIWIAVDILYVGLYVYKGLMLTAVLYGVFVLLAIAGLRAWSAHVEQRT